VGKGGGGMAGWRKKRAVAGLKFRMGRLTAGPVGPKVRKKYFLNKI
jgi:hypothetical protein